MLERLRNRGDQAKAQERLRRLRKSGLFLSLKIRPTKAQLCEIC